MIKALLFWGFLSLTLSAKDPNPWFVDQNLVYERGNELSQEYLHHHEPEFESIRKKILPWIVRIEAQHSFEKNKFTSNHGTGTILKGGLVVTAHHVFTKNIPPKNKKLKILITLNDGRVFPATLLKHGSSDWILLKMDLKNAPSGKLTQSPIILRPPRQHETGIFFGYPARLGLDQQGKVQSFHKGSPKTKKKKKIPTSRLNPMTVVASVTNTKTMTLTPLAGFPPVGGMSGGPIFSLKGEVIAVQHSVTTTTDNATGKILSYRIDATPINEIDLPQP
jgi:S1-C subfamily serine protease